nr:MAG TPA: hypothetical protein [Caudoviricetes sp.]
MLYREINQRFNGFPREVILYKNNLVNLIRGV